jgi:hypothetical protein
MSTTVSPFFEATVAHAFIVGSSVFGIFWGVVNALLVSNKNLYHIANSFF